MNSLLDAVVYVVVIPLAWIGLYALLDSHLVSKTAIVSDSLVEMAKSNGDEVIDALSEKSEYAIGWLKIDDTNINYPVVQGKNNTWFLNRGYTGEFATAGSLFLDYRNKKDFSDSFSIIYGHRMGNGEMFSDVQKFKNEYFFNMHRRGVLKLERVNYDLEIVAYAEVDANDWNIYNVDKSRLNSDAETTREIYDVAT